MTFVEICIAVSVVLWLLILQNQRVHAFRVKLLGIAYTESMKLIKAKDEDLGKYWKEIDTLPSYDAMLFNPWIPLKQHVRGTLFEKLV